MTIKDAAAYGLILTQGYGTFGGTAGVDAVDDPLRTDDRGRTVRHRRRGARKVYASRTRASTDPLVILKHFGPGNPDAEPLRDPTDARTRVIRS